MSHLSTPHLTNKRTPGRLASDTPGQMNSTTFSEPTRPVLNSSRSVCDAQAASAKQLLNAYIYEFLVKNTLPLTAKCFVSEADVPSVPYDLSHLLTRTSPLLPGRDKDISGTPQTPAVTVNQLLEDHNIPNLAVSMESPQGFLYEWWHVFWDIFQASTDQRASTLATQYHQMQSFKQKQFEIQNMESSQNMSQLAAMAQTQQHVQIPPHLQGPMPIMANPGPIPMQLFQRPPPNQILQLQPQQMQLLDSRQRYMMQMMMKQQQAQQLQQAQAQAHAQQLQLFQQQPNPLQSLQPQQQLPIQQQSLQNQQLQQLQQQRPNLQLISQQGLQQALQQAQQQRPILGIQQQLSQQSMTQQGVDQPMNSLAVNGNVNGNMPQQPMFLLQQDQQARMQQLSQSQMSTLPHQAAVALQLLQQMQGIAPNGGVLSNARDSDDSIISSQRVNSAPRGRMSSQQGTQLQFSQQNIGSEGALFAQQPVGQNLVNIANSGNNTPGSVVNTPSTQTMNTQQTSNQSQNVAITMNQNHNNNSATPNNNFSSLDKNGNGGNNGMAQMSTFMVPSNSTNALQDYQMQLMLLEKQNKKRLDIARLTGNGDAAVGQIIQMPSGTAQLKNSPIPSPGTNNKASPNPSSLNSAKKAVKRGRKTSFSSNAVSPLTTASAEASTSSLNGRSTGIGPKKDIPAPLTPAAESEGGKKKRKNTGTDTTTKKSAKPTIKKEKPAPKTKKSSTVKNDADASDNNKTKPDSADSAKMPPPGGSFYQTISSEKTMSVDILSSGNSGEGVFLGTGGNSTIDDVDFDFNLFLDGGDVGLNDGLTGFNWGNPIEGAD